MKLQRLQCSADSEEVHILGECALRRTSAAWRHGLGPLALAAKTLVMDFLPSPSIRRRTVNKLFITSTNRIIVRFL